MTQTRQQLFEEALQASNIQFETDIKGGANYEAAIEHDNQMYVSGMIPRVQGAIAVTGRIGQETSLEDGRRAARICVLRATALLRQLLGNLDRVEKILKLTVYVQSAADFTQQSEVADAASDLLYTIFAPSGGHARTSVGVYQLPKNASVEIDMIVALHAPVFIDRA